MKYFKDNPNYVCYNKTYILSLKTWQSQDVLPEHNAGY